MQGNQDDPPAYLGPWSLGPKMSGEVVQLVKPTNRLIKIFPHVINHVIQKI
jgi:hypothetical protein